MTVAFEEKAVLEFKGRMLMMTVLLLKDLDPNTLHRQVSQRLEDAAQWLRDAPVVVDLAQPEGADQVALMAAVDTLRGLGVNLVALARNEHLDSDTAAMLGLGSISLAGGRDVPRSAEPAPQAEQPADAGHTLVIDQPVRSGQQIYSRGDLIVLAPVSTGAELLAEGHIHVYNTLRGRALAGVRGDQSARIFCQKLDAELVSIAGIYRVAEDLPEQHRKQAVHITLDGDAMRFADLK
ncbi:septum site-determining protein MinC [Alloalcanivorax venustensis]|jgi:septum site-determining protein MinC|uniref:Probable septum site-determining protein MinC n=1 Tax=Alloalcanivorax venustensis ISO4 TaxID=1177184 RepID=A0ABS0ALI9_9GAMM|nr:septum site-determining protein MinC [Alloalcanivorax venustensis]MAD69574.1 septum site-determining protein MinC [Alcanivorax sp.]MCH9783053.1 septum site-determining protein MinC [Gammaproteobacteria bacterium]MEA3261774.1 septum site-determining protein MinC [Pseudomonadota bacterium]SMO77985.1 septum site-determining protein MinC [Alcanivorax sp. DSM 26295]MAD72134.1 septum site-determining protein MinC [Alcanivorax sp.]|tara:strand:- start:12428 stop:13138 length:711 start_codon:yes stop_codon:yes gene_type:complete